MAIPLKKPLPAVIQIQWYGVPSPVILSGSPNRMDGTCIAKVLLAVIASFKESWQCKSSQTSLKPAKWKKCLRHRYMPAFMLTDTRVCRISDGCTTGRIAAKGKSGFDWSCKRPTKTGFENDSNGYWRKSGRSSRSFKVKKFQGLGCQRCAQRAWKRDAWWDTAAIVEPLSTTKVSNG